MGSFIKRNKEFIPFLVMLGFWLVMYSFIFPQGDDFRYKVGSVPDIFDFYRVYFMTSGARMANILAQLFLLSDLAVWKIVTPFLLIILSFVVFYFIKQRVPKEATQLSDIKCAIFCSAIPLFIPVANNVFGDTLIWNEGTCNYLYPLVFLLIGVIPLYNKFNGIITTKPIFVLSFICSVLSMLLQEQIAITVFAICLAGIIAMRIKLKSVGIYYYILMAVSSIICAFHFLCPGALARLRMTSSSSNKGFITTTFWNLIAYLNEYASGYWLYAFGIGIACLFLLSKRTVKSGKILRNLIVAEIIALTLYKIYSLTFTNLPEDNKIRLIINIICAVVVFLFVITAFVVFIISANSNNKYLFLVVMYVGMWASQLIPAVLNGIGRPVLHLVFISVFISYYVFSETEGNQRKIITSSLAVIGAISICFFVYNLQYNYKQYRDVERQVQEAKMGEIDKIVVFKKKFSKKYMYFNSFCKAYESDFKQFYKLPDYVTVEFIQ